MTQLIDKTMQKYVDTGEMLGGILYVHKNGKLLFKNKWGYSDIEQTTPISYDTIFRIASMSKVLTAAGILKLQEQDKIGLDDEASKYLPEFANIQVVEDERFEGIENVHKYLITGERAPVDGVKTVPSEREFTIRDLLTHSSGLEMGIYGMLSRMRIADKDDTLEKRMEKFSKLALDFQPGTNTGYSPLGSFDMLARIIEVISGQSFDEYMRKEIFEPLEMVDATFHLTDEQKERLIPLHKPEGGKISDVSGTLEDINGIAGIGPNYMSASGGIYCTVEDYDHFTQMLLNHGLYKDTRILKTETVKMIHEERAYKHLEPEQGMEWGLGVQIRQNPKVANSFASPGTYGWSGAFGTHFLVSPNENLAATFAMNRADIGGSGSYISAKVEELVFSIWGEIY